MQVAFHDRAPLEKVRRLADGRITAVAKFARSGCYSYTGRELGRPELSSVTVYRPEDEVFAADAMASFAHQSITLDHPAEGVSPANWRKVSVGFTEGRVARDGGYVEIPLMLADAEAVSAYDSGRARELSAGYSCELVWGDGVAPDGTHFQATQRQIRGNHIALVPQGRAGSECRIGDSAVSCKDGGEKVAAHVARERYIHETKFAFMGDRAPAFDEATAQVVAQAKFAAENSKAIRDAVLFGRHETEIADARVQREGARREYIESLAAPSTETVRDAIRAARHL
ncbi:DUF2213 domain-containing protein [Sphingobium terrigena]|uniref:DUF2213 domain-containing protein n=1 Tax=Sphingobium terrigena TaxID=2304063 RepID=A0A418YLE0_9SPHN|nr:DUF2213 domain-containing protein [Sphingobium terrigena]RJG51798.1 DUF2213 domain-containing protein [Sphingobium terrigena]